MKKILMLFTAILMSLFLVQGVSADSFPEAPYRGGKITIIGNVMHTLMMDTGLEGASDASYSSLDPSIVEIVSQQVWNLNGVPLAIIKGKKAGSTTIVVSVTAAAGDRTIRIPITVVPYENPLKTFKVGSTNLASKYAKTNMACYTGKRGKQTISFTVKSGWKATLSYGYWVGQNWKEIIVKSGSKADLDEVVNKCYSQMTMVLEHPATGLRIEDTLFITDKAYTYDTIPPLPNAPVKTPTPTPAPKKTLTVSSSSISVKEGKTARITAKTTPKATISYKSENTKVAKVTFDGTVTGIKAGTTTIVVKANGLTRKVSVKVTSKIYDVSKANLDNLFSGKNGWSQFSEFKKGLTKSASVQVPGLTNTNLTPQGYCTAGDYILMSAYIKNGNSVIYVIDKKTKKKLTAIEIKGDYGNACYELISHVGGLTYDGTYVYIADSNSKIQDGGKNSKAVWKLSYSEIQNAAKKGADKSVLVVKNVEMNAKVTPSSMTYYNGYYYTCEFNKNKNSRIQAYIMGANGKLSKVGKPYTLQEKNVQGLAFYHKGNTDYMLITTSYGKTNPSTLYTKTVKITNGQVKETGSARKPMVLPNMAENISIEGKKIYFGFESGANQYATGSQTKPLGYILVGNVEKYL